MKKIMGLDQSYTKTGVVIMEKGNPSMIHYEKITSDKEKDYFERAWDIATRITFIVKEYKVDAVIIEGLAFGSRGDQTRNLGGLQFTIINMLRFGDCSTPPSITIVAPTTLKKFATGKGNAKKELMIECLDPEIKKIFWGEMKLRKSTGLDDMTDAYFLSQYGLTNEDN